MAKDTPGLKNLESSDRIILSGLLGTSFEILFGLEIVFNCVFLSANIIAGIISAVGFTALFAVMCVLLKFDLKQFTARGLSLLFSYLVIILLIPWQVWPVLIAFAVFVSGNSAVKIAEGLFGLRRIISFYRTAVLTVFSAVSFLVLIYFLSGSAEIFLRIGSAREFLTGSDKIILCAIISVFFAALNSLEPKWLRNFIFPVAAAVLLFLSFSIKGLILISDLEIAFAASIIISILSHRLKFLTAEGSYAQFVLAFLILGLGGWKWTIPIIVFFISSSLLSKLKTKYKNSAELYFEKTGIRDSGQVYVNGGLGGILVIINALYPSELFYLAYVSSIAVVCSDTWATEIGTLWRTSTVSILNFSEVEQGTSGGVSLPGLGGALIGAFIIPVTSLFWSHSIFLIFTAGFMGSIADSYLGAVFQAQYKCSKCGKVTEREMHCNNKTSLIKGFSWFDNDAVNLTSAVITAAVVLILKEII